MLENTVDVATDGCGSITMLTPLTKAGRDWMAEHLETESWQWMGLSLAIEPRCAEAIIVGMYADGLVLS